MSKPFDYSKWDKIELSDDEEDVHPNIDRESWFRMKHRSRVEREDHEDKDKKRIQDEVRKLLDVQAFSGKVFAMESTLENVLVGVSAGISVRRFSFMLSNFVFVHRWRRRTSV